MRRRVIRAEPGYWLHELHFPKNDPALRLPFGVSTGDLTDEERDSLLCHDRHPVVAWELVVSEQELVTKPIIAALNVTIEFRYEGNTFHALERPDGSFTDWSDGYVFSGFEAWLEDARRTMRGRHE